MIITATGITEQSRITLMNGNMTTIVDMGQTGKNPSKMISYTFAPLIFYWILLTLLVCTFNMDISESNSFSVDLNISTFNCHGLKSSMGYMTELVTTTNKQTKYLFIVDS